MCPDSHWKTIDNQNGNFQTIAQMKCKRYANWIHGDDEITPNYSCDAGRMGGASAGRGKGGSAQQPPNICLS